LLGNVYFAEGRKADALVEYQKTLALQPDNTALKAFVDSQQATMAAAPAASATAAPTAAPAAAPTQMAVAPSSDLDKVHGVFGGFGGLSLGADSFAGDPNYTYSTGGHFGSYMGLAFDRHFSVVLKTGIDSFSVTSRPVTYYEGVFPAAPAGTITFLNVMSSCRYVFLNSGVLRPYVTLGFGTDILVSTYVDDSYSQASTIPVIEFGVGGTVSLNRDWDIFAEVDYDEFPEVVFNTYNSISYIPISIGVQFNAY